MTCGWHVRKKKLMEGFEIMSFDERDGIAVSVSQLEEFSLQSLTAKRKKVKWDVPPVF